VHSMLLELALVMGVPKKIRSSAASITAALSGEQPAIHALLAEQQRKSVGLIIFFLTFSTWRGAPGVYVQDIYVAAPLRGSGLGRQLLQAAAAWGAKHGADHLRLSVDPDNTAARAFYAGAGLSLREDEVIYAAIDEAYVELSKKS